MKNIFLSILLLLQILFLSRCKIQSGAIPIQSGQTEYTIDIKIKGLTDSVAYLGTYTGKNLYFYDTAVVRKDGSFTFKNNNMPHGVYAVIPSMNPPKYFDILVNEQTIKLETNLENLAGNVVVKKSKENKLFFEYVQFLEKQAKLKEPLIKERKIAFESKETKKVDELNKKIIAIDSAVIDYQIAVSTKNIDTYFGKLISMSVETTIPEPSFPLADTNKWKYEYYTNHFWDNVDLSDDRLGKSALFYNQMETYFMKVIAQIPDTINQRIDAFMNQLTPNGFMMKSAVEFLAYAHAKTKIMGMESVYVHVADNYILNGRSNWIDQDKIEKLRPKVDKLRPTLIGKIAPNIILADTSEKNWINLANVNHEYTLLIFWAEDCGHCKKEIPKFKKVYDSLKNISEIDLEVYAVCTSIENDDWRKFIKEKELDWINVSDFQEMREDHMKYLIEKKTTLESINYRNIYDVFVTPVAYLLDKDKRIVAKQFDSDQLSEILKVLQNRKK